MPDQAFDALHGNAYGAAVIDEHQELFAVEVSGAAGFADSTFFAPVEQEGAEIFDNSLHIN